MKFYLILFLTFLITGPVIAQSPDKSKIAGYFNQGTDYFKQGKYELAIKEWKKVLAIDPNHQISKDKIQKAQQMLKADKPVVSQIKKPSPTGLTKPVDYTVNLEKSKKLIEQGKIDEAEEELFNLINLNQGLIPAYLLLAEIYETRRKNPEMAVHILGVGLENKPQSGELRKKLALVYERLYKSTKNKMYKEKAVKEWGILKALTSSPEAEEHLKKLK